MPDYRPRENLESVVLDDELMIYDPVRDETHILNETAAEIWRLLTEKKSVSEIMDHCFEQYQTGEKEDLSGNPSKHLESLESKGPPDPGALLRERAAGRGRTRGRLCPGMSGGCPKPPRILWCSETWRFSQFNPVVGRKRKRYWSGPGAGSG